MAKKLKFNIWDVEDPESAGMKEKDVKEMWQYLVDTGMVWRLQGWYGRSATNLIKSGVDSNKTDCMVFPDINEEYYSYFIAGLFDGDGSVYKGNKNSIRINLIATMEIILSIEKILMGKFLLKNLYIRKVTENKSNVWKMYLSKDCYAFLDFIYQDKSFEYLSRKKEMYLKYKKKIK